MHLHRDFGETQTQTDVFVAVAFRQQYQNLPLPCRERRQSIF